MRLTDLLRVVSLLALMAVPASAQTNPCDLTPVSNPTVQASSIWYGLCFPVKHDDGTFVQYTSFRVTVDGATVFSGMLTQKYAPTATGWSYYETPLIPIAKGTHTAVSYSSNADGESLGSPPYGFQIKGVPPGRGKIQAVGK